MAKGELGARILRQAKSKEVPIGDVIINVRQMTAMRLFTLQQSMPEKEEEMSKAIIRLHKEDPNFISGIIVECCTDPVSGDPVFTLEQAHALPADLFTLLLQEIMLLSKAPEADDLKS